MAKKEATMLDRSVEAQNSVSSAIESLLTEEVQKENNRFYPVALELGDGCKVTGLRIRLLTKEQIDGQKSKKGAVIGFIDVQIGGRVIINSLKLWRPAGKRAAMLLNPSEFSEKRNRWYTDVYFTLKDRELILQEARRIVRARVQEKAS